jgi:hypothetical protein
MKIAYHFEEVVRTIFYNEQRVKFSCLGISEAVSRCVIRNVLIKNFI